MFMLTAQDLPQFRTNGRRLESRGLLVRCDAVLCASIRLWSEYFNGFFMLWLLHKFVYDVCNLFLMDKLSQSAFRSIVVLLHC